MGEGHIAGTTGIDANRPKLSTIVSSERKQILFPVKSASKSQCSACAQQYGGLNGEKGLVAASFVKSYFFFFFLRKICFYLRTISWLGNI